MFRLLIQLDRFLILKCCSWTYVTVQPFQSDSIPLAHVFSEVSRRISFVAHLLYVPIWNMFRIRTHEASGLPIIEIRKPLDVFFSFISLIHKSSEFPSFFLKPQLVPHAGYHCPAAFLSSDTFF